MVAGVDWANGGWLAVIFSDGSYEECLFEEDFEKFWKDHRAFDQILVDVPIGLPDETETLASRDTLDSLARTVTGRSSSVFPVPSRRVSGIVSRNKASYEKAARQNEKDIGKGLTQQSYHIAAGIGEVDAILRKNEQAREIVVESHPEVCFRGLLGRQLQYSKKTAAGIGERLEALDDHTDNPGTLLKEVSGDLIGESDNIEIDDVMDALALGVTATRSEDEIRYLPEDWKTDAEGLPMRMAYWAEESFSPQEQN